MDHLIGFDHLLRLHLGRETRLRLFGPAGTGDRIEARLGGYTWNLVDDYVFALEVWDLSGGRLTGSRFRAVTGFEREPLESRDAPGGRILEEPSLIVHAEELDHGIVSLGYRLEEPERLNVDADAMKRHGLEPGPWVAGLKTGARAGASAGDPLKVETAGRGTERWTRGRAERELLRRAPGHVIAYASDLAWSDENARAVERLARGADPFLCEATFRETEAAEAERRRHLTARQAGLLAKRAGARRLVLFHLSPRYSGTEEEHLHEARAVFGEAASLA